MNKLKLTILFLFMSLAASAQRLAVESLKLRPNDLSARNVKNQRHDLNGKPCALLKVMVLDDITKCSSGNIGDIVTEGPVKLIFITSATPSIELSFKYHYPLTINFVDYGYKHLEGNSTYELNLVDAQQMMMGNGNEASQTTPLSTNLNASSSLNSNGNLIMSAEEANKIARDAYNAKNYAKAMKYYLYAANKNHDLAQYMIGVMYNNGEGVTQDSAEAFKWYLKAAEQGHVFAQYNIGCMYDSGEGVQQDYSEALKWYLKAAEQGDDYAKYNIAVMYSKGQGVRQNYTKSFEWFLQAAEQDNTYAIKAVGDCYYDGLGVEKNIDKAVSWYRRGADKGDTNCKEALKHLGK